MQSKVVPGIQTFFKAAGEAACYALCIIRLAEKITCKSIEPIEALIIGIKHLAVYYNWENPDDGDNFFVNAPDAFLGMLTGKHITVRKVDNIGYQPALNEYIVERWERPTPKMIYAHFKLPDWDSLYNSQTVKYGKIASLRVFKVE
jgi:hypothetical protein